MSIRSGVEIERADAGRDGQIYLARLHSQSRIGVDHCIGVTVVSNCKDNTLNVRIIIRSTTVVYMAIT